MLETQPILLIGETRSGKTTFINSFRDYIARHAFDSDGVKALIGMHHYLLDKDYNQETFFLGPPSSSDNERNNIEKPSTRRIKSKKVIISNHRCIFIDTPGIGDGRGSRYDDNNIDNIVKTVHNLEKPPIVCIFIDSVSERDNTTFALKKIVELMEKIKYEEVYFIFTKTRRSAYSPGEKLNSIVEVLPEELKKKVLSRDHFFCFDNEGFNYSLMMTSSEVPDNFKSSYQRYEDNFRESWKHSKKEAKRLKEKMLSSMGVLPVQRPVSDPKTRELPNKEGGGIDAVDISLGATVATVVAAITVAVFRLMR